MEQSASLAQFPASRRRDWAAAAEGHAEHAASRWALMQRHAPLAVAHALWGLAPKHLEVRAERNVQLRVTEKERELKIVPRAIMTLPVSARSLQHPVRVPTFHASRPRSLAGFREALRHGAVGGK